MDRDRLTRAQVAVARDGLVRVHVVRLVEPPFCWHTVGTDRDRREIHRAVCVAHPSEDPAAVPRVAPEKVGQPWLVGLLGRFGRERLDDPRAPEALVRIV